jgi:hypothetical protein
VRKQRPVFFVILLALLVVFYFSKRNGTRHEADNPEFNRTLAPLVITKHARCRMDCRQISEAEVKEILQRGKINRRKSEPNDKPDPKYALEGITSDGQSVRIIFAPAKRGMVVITVIDLEKEWECACN